MSFVHMANIVGDIRGAVARDIGFVIGEEGVECRLFMFESCESRARLSRN